MEAIIFAATYGDEKKEVELSQPNGGAGGYHVYVNHYYQGVILRLNDEWVYYDKWLTTDDVQALTEIIEEFEDKD